MPGPVIRVLERLGWATKVRWPTAARFHSRRHGPGQDQQQAALQPGGPWTAPPAAPASRLSPLPAGSDRIR
jgi:hypothetical protein